MYLDGILVEQDLSAAFKYFQQAVSLEDPVGLRYLGKMHLEGLGVERSNTEAARLWRLAAEKGDLYSQCYLGAGYYSGELESEHKELDSVKWYKMAAKQGFVSAQFQLALIFDLSAAANPQNKPKALKYYKMAAENGHVSAQFNLGLIYDKGL